MTEIRDRLLLLRSLEEFGGLDDEGLLLLVENARERAYSAGEYVLRAGDEPTVIHVVIDGEIVVKRAGLPDLVIPQRRAFGLIAVMAEARNQDAIAAVDTRVLEIPVKGYRAALEENFSLMRNALRFLGALLSKMRQGLPADPKRPPKDDIGVYYEHPRTLVEQLIELRKGPFVHMNIDALVDLARRMAEVRVPAGHVFWRAGALCTYALHVEYGRVRCTAPNGASVDVASDFTIGTMDSDTDTVNWPWSNGDSWGTVSQRRTASGAITVSIAVAHGTLAVTTVRIDGWGSNTPAHPGPVHAGTTIHVDIAL